MNVLKKDREPYAKPQLIKHDNIKMITREDGQMVL